VTVTAGTTLVSHDETAGVGASGPNTANDVAGSTIAYGSTTVASVFAGVPNKGSDADVGVKDNGAIGFAASVGALVSIASGSFGADGPAQAGAVIYALKVSDGTFSGVRTTEGVDIFLYNGVDGLILGRVGTDESPGLPNATGIVAFALGVDASSGRVFIAQYLSLDHGTGGSTDAAHDNAIQLASAALAMEVTYKDWDGDTATSSANIDHLVSFQDDRPTVAVLQSVVVANWDETSATAALTTAGGSDGLASLAISGATSGGYAVDSGGSFLTTGAGTKLVYVTVGDVLYAVPDGTLSDNYVSSAVFSVDPNAIAGNYTVTVLGQLNPVTKTFNSNFGTTDAGGPDDPYTANFTSAELGITQTVHLFGFGAGKANASTDGLGVGNNLIDAGSGKTPNEKLGALFVDATVTQVTLDIGNFSSPDQFLWKPIVFTALPDLSLYPDVDPALSGYSLSEFLDSFVLESTLTGEILKAKLAATGLLVEIGHVVGIDSSTPYTPATVNGPPGAGEESDVDTYYLKATEGFNFLYVEGTNNSFKIVSMQIEAGKISDPIKVNFTATSTDGDGDTAIAPFQVTFAGNKSGSYNLVGTDGDDVLVGSPNGDSLAGGSGQDILNGGGGDDILVYDPADLGGSAATVYDGGAGSDTLRFASASQSLDLMALAQSKIQNIEVIDLTGTGNNTLALTPEDVLDLSSTTNQLIVMGNAGDVINSTGQGWNRDSTTTTIGGQVYDVYTKDVGGVIATLLVDSDITRNLN